MFFFWINKRYHELNMYFGGPLCVLNVSPLFRSTCLTQDGQDYFCSNSWGSCTSLFVLNVSVSP